MAFRTPLFLSLLAALAFVSPLPAQWSLVDLTGNGDAVEESLGVPSPVMDPMGDAVDSFMAGPPLLDIDTVDVTFGTATLNFSMSFFGPIAPASSGAPNSVVGVIDLDVDQNASTGGEPAQNVYSPPFASVGAGIDFRIDLFSESLHAGMADVINEDFEVVGTVPLTYSATSVSGSVPLSLLAGDDGEVDFAAIIGTIPQPTDAMDVLGLSVPVPEPTTATLLLFGLACFGHRPRAARGDRARDGAEGRVFTHGPVR